MDWIIGILIVALQLLFFVILPLIAIWLIARKGHAARVITFIVSIIAVAVIAFMTGFSACQHHLSRRYYEEFIQPFTLLMDHLKALADQNEYEALSSQINRLAEAQITYVTKGGNTNTLWRFVDELKEKESANNQMQATGVPPAPDL